MVVQRKDVELSHRFLPARGLRRGHDPRIGTAPAQIARDRPAHLGLLLPPVKLNFLLRGQEKVSLEWTLVSTSYNLKRLFTLKNLAGAA